VNFTRLLRITAMAVGLSGLLCAQGGPAMGMGRGTRGRMMLGGGRGQTLMWSYLGLTDAQKTQARTIFENARTAAQPIQTQLQQARTDLRAAITAGQPVQTLATQQGDLLGQLIAIRANAQVQFRAILTPDQLAKLDEFQAQRPRRGAGAMGPSRAPGGNAPTQ
jgi:Spy/CpxP family protein refolding chaperone